MNKLGLQDKMRKFWKKNGGCYLFLIPAFIGFFVFSVYPVVYSLFLSFTDSNGARFTEIGLFNYWQIFSDDLLNGWATISNSFWLTFRYALMCIPIGLTLSFFLALLLNSAVKGIKFFRILYYLLVLIPGLAMSIIYADMFDYPGGIINQIVVSLGGKAVPFFEDPGIIMPWYMVAGFFGLGGNMIMWLAALANVPKQLIEAAKIDGARGIRVLFSVIIPMCTPIIFYNLINSVITSLQIFDTYASLGVGPEESMYFIVILIYRVGFESYQMGFACAVAWMLFVVIALLTLVMFKTQKWVVYLDEES